MVTAAAIRAHYDSLAFIYRTFWGDHIHHGLFVDGDSPARAQLRLVEHCTELLGELAVRDVLDVGCGHGATAIYLAEQYRCRVLGITISEKQAQIAREHAARAGVEERVTFLADDAETFSYPVEKFDLLWMMESSEHFADKFTYFKNVARTLRVGGALLLTAWTGEMASSRIREVAQRFLCHELWTQGQYETAIKSSGLKLRTSEDLSSHVVRTWEICRERAKAAALAVRLLPRAAREFVDGIDVILDAYRSGELAYTIIVAEKFRKGV